MSKGRRVPPALPRDQFAPVTRINPTQAEVLAAMNTPGGYVLEYQHDRWCRIFTGGRCNCEPHVQLLRTKEPSR